MDWMASKRKNETVSAFSLSRVPEKSSKDAHQRFKLGLGDWTESSSEEESEKKKIATGTEKAKTEPGQEGTRS